MKCDIHIDLSNKFFTKKTTGIAALSIPNKKHKGCALSNRLKRDIEKRISKNSKNIYAKLYAICIYYLIKNDLQHIKRLIICNDEDFKQVQKYLLQLINKKLEIISIFEFRRSLERNIKSPADNLARIYSKRGLKKNR